MRPQCGFLLGCQLKHEVDRKSRKVALDLFIESFGRHSVEGRQVAIEKNVLMSEDQNRFRNPIYAQRPTGIDPRCHRKAHESDPLHCQLAMMGNQSRKPAWLPRYGCSVSMGNAEGWNRRKSQLPIRSSEPGRRRVREMRSRE
jgi:hypothetical protein